MIIFPAIDMIGGQAVRLVQGDYCRMTVYDRDPVAVAQRFRNAGASHLHLVDLDGAKSGTTPNLKTVERIRNATDLFLELGGGIRDLNTVQTYFSIGVDRVILGTAAVTDRNFLCAALEQYGSRIAVGVDIKDGRVAIHGWQETAALEGVAFCRALEALGVSNLICTDISRDGAMKGTNLALYETLRTQLGLNVTASGGVSDLEDIRRLKAMGLYGAIIGKACYTGAIDLKEALEVAK